MASGSSRCNGTVELGLPAGEIPGQREYHRVLGQLGRLEPQRADVEPAAFSRLAHTDEENRYQKDRRHTVEERSSRLERVLLTGARRPPSARCPCPQPGAASAPAGRLTARPARTWRCGSSRCRWRRGSGSLTTRSRVEVSQLSTVHIGSPCVRRPGRLGIRPSAGRLRLRRRRGSAARGGSLILKYAFMTSRAIGRRHRAAAPRVLDDDGHDDRRIVRGSERDEPRVVLAVRILCRPGLAADLDARGCARAFRFRSDASTTSTIASSQERDGGRPRTAASYATVVRAVPMIRPE